MLQGGRSDDGDAARKQQQQQQQQRRRRRERGGVWSQRAEMGRAPGEVRAEAGFLRVQACKLPPSLGIQPKPEAAAAVAAGTRVALGGSGREKTDGACEVRGDVRRLTARVVGFGSGSGSSGSEPGCCSRKGTEEGSLDGLLSATIKRNLRHTCVCDGCIIALPFLGDEVGVQVESVEYSKPSSSRAGQHLLQVGWITRSTFITLLPSEGRTKKIPAASAASYQEHSLGTDLDGEYEAEEDSTRERKMRIPSQCSSLLDIILTFCRSPARYRRFLPRGVLLSGPPGVGKTFSVKRACQIAGVTPTCVYGSETSLDELRSAFGSGHEMEGEKDDSSAAVVFMDEIDALASSRSVLLGELLRCLDREPPRVLIVGATNRPHALDPAIRRAGRIDREIFFPPPNELARRDILRSFGVSDREAREVGERAAGYVAADLASLCRESLCRKISLAQAMSRCGRPSALRHANVIDRPRGSWAEVGGGEGAKEALKRAVEWPLKYREAFKRFGLGRSGGVLLHGPPGCGKTSLVRAAAAESGLAFVSCSCADIFSPYVGEAEASVRSAFRLARAASPSLLFFDEMDALVGGGRGSGAESRVLATFLNEMDGVDAGSAGSSGSNVTVLAATNRLAAVDAALLRPGRFDTVILVPPPTALERQAILKVHTRGIPLDGDVDLGHLARSEAEGLTGAQIEGACREAAIAALREGTAADDKLSAVMQDPGTPIRVTRRHLADALLQAYRSEH